MPYEPQYYSPLYSEPNPFGFMPSQMQQRRPMQYAQINGDQLIKVTGEAGIAALAKNMGPNSRAAAFDANEDILYIITTDGAAYPSWQSFDFTLRNNAAQQAQTSYVTQDEFNSFKTDMKEAMEDVKQLIRTGKLRSTTVNAKPSSNEL